MEDQLPKFQFNIEFKKAKIPHSKTFSRRARAFLEETYHLDLLEASQNPPRLFFLEDFSITQCKYDSLISSFEKNKTQNLLDYVDNGLGASDIPEPHCMKISPCQRYLAVMNNEYIWIFSIGAHFSIMKIGEEQVKFKLERTEPDDEEIYDYVTLQWPPLSDSYFENPYFFSMNSNNTIKLHYINDHTTVAPNHEELLCASFSHNGEHILSINTQNELCMMDPSTLETLSRKAIPQLDHYKNIKIAHIFQIDQNHIALGAFYSSQEEDEEEYEEVYEVEKEFQSIVYILSGDFVIPDSQIRIYAYQMDAVFYTTGDDYSDFKFQYLKERNLFFYTNNASSCIYTLYFGKNENIIEFPSIEIPIGTIRGFVSFKSLVRTNIKKRHFEQDYDQSPANTQSKVSFIILTSEGNFLRYDMHKIGSECPENERKIRTICKEKTPKTEKQEQGQEQGQQQGQQQEEVKPLENLNMGQKPLSGQYTLGPNLFLKLKDRPNLFAKKNGEEAAPICLQDDHYDSLNKRDEGMRSNGGFNLFSKITKKDNKVKSKTNEENNKFGGLFKGDLFGKENNGNSAANSAFGSLFGGAHKGNENKKNEEGGSTLFGGKKPEKLKEE